MPRQARLDSPGTLHHVIIRGIEKKKIVSCDQDRQDFVARMGTIALETETSVYAWALMTNHAHILLRSGPSGLSRYMRRLLSGYAISYNRRHRRHGHLFQNRYKSIVCEEDSYFKELVRYIHLNPLRAKLVDNLTKLDRYRYCGHSVLMGRVKNDWQDRDYVLEWFGSKEGEAKRAYRRFVKMGIDQGHRSDLTGGGLIRSQGGWSAVNALRRLGVREKSDERILGMPCAALVYARSRMSVF
jgi:REP element-mobilizing transposase RayT